jgi:hypothetical protein
MARHVTLISDAGMIRGRRARPARSAAAALKKIAGRDFQQSPAGHG